ncbi:Protein of unknown function DUF1064 [uncultured Caudovirales phage]|uniref:Uncharacterized protein n=1 Tax=uncultured Caudovirales phage TaxID=2100421 RepID=A0A6J5LTJ1_9CAUD|nr:Protein of unknown function DUF1064 [uncultured Caudovirales phage]
MKIIKWTTEDLELLKRYYPRMGKKWCMEAMCRTEASVRYKAAELGLKLDRESEFAKDFQSRAAKSKIGKKRPDQALVIKKLHAEGKLKKTNEQKEQMSQRVKRWHSLNPHPRGMLGKNHTEEIKQKLRLTSKEAANRRTEEQESDRIMKIAKTKEKNGTHAPERKNVTWKGGWREIGGYKKYYRSRWEANYARFLQWLKETGKIKEWKHEPKTFWFEGIKRGCVSYLPDFWVEELDGNDSFHEVKGWMDDRSKTKIKRMAKYYPNVSLVVIAAKEYKSIEDNFSRMIEGWETKGKS